MEVNSQFGIYAVAVIIVLLGVVVLLAVRLRKARAEGAKAMEEYKQLEEKLNSKELEAIEHNLDPHLLKNILNSIQSHAFQTYHTIDKLSGVLDYMLYDSRRNFVTPREEIEFGLNLIEINKIKISPLFDLKVKVKVNEQEPLYQQRLLAPLICGNLIENAFKHADLQSPKSFIAITFELKDNVFELTVANKISPLNPMQREKGGMGSGNFKQRLKLIYQDHYKLSSFTEDEVYIAQLKIDLFEFKAKMLTAGR